MSKRIKENMANSHKKRWNRQIKIKKNYFSNLYKKTNCKNYYILFRKRLNLKKSQKKY